MVCRGCGREIAGSARFCVHCGASVENGEQTERFCSVCGSPLHRESAFCPKCGAQQRKVRTQSAADGMNAMSWKRFLLGGGAAGTIAGTFMILNNLGSENEVGAVVGTFLIIISVISFLVGCFYK